MQEDCPTHDAPLDPVRRLTTTIETITRDGDWSARVPRDLGGDLGELCRALDVMIGQFARSQSALWRVHDELEQRVEDRAAQLWSEIARRELVQRDLEQSKEAAEAASRAKSEFLANMSHEIRTPLNGILGFTDLLLQGADDGDADLRHDYLATIQTSGRHLLTLINDILDLSKIEAGRMRIESAPCSIGELIDEVVSVLRVKADEKHLEFRLRWESDVPASVQTDAARLRQLLMNLVGNAIKFTETGGVEVVAQVERSGEEPTLHVQVVDTGVGIAAEQLDEIFDPFVQADNSATRRFGGTGLGLAISRRIAAGLGGRLNVDSEPGVGSTFGISIPIGPLDGVDWNPPSQAASRSLPTVPRNDEAVHLIGASILVVEDGETNRKLFRLILSRAGANVATTENGKIALEEVARQPFDLILMDMQMPVMDGYRATRILRDRGFAGPIIALTAHAMKGDEQRCRDAGCTGYLTKPVDAGELLRTVAALGDFESSNMGREKGSGTFCAKHPPGRSGKRFLTPFPALVSTLPSDDADFREIVAEFVARFRQKHNEMRAAYHRDDMAELAELAHWLKGSGGTAGFAELSEAAARIERAIAGGEFRKIGQEIEMLEHLAERITLSCVQT